MRQDKQFVAHMFCKWLFSHNIAVPIEIKEKTYFLSLSSYTTVFDWGDGNINRNIRWQLVSFIWQKRNQYSLNGIPKFFIVIISGIMRSYWNRYLKFNIFYSIIFIHYIIMFFHGDMYGWQIIVIFMLYIP